MWNPFRRLMRDVTGLLPQTSQACSIENRVLGELAVPSRYLMIADPQYIEGAPRIGPTATERGHITATCLVDPRGAFEIASLHIRFTDSEGMLEEFGGLAVDGAKALIADAADYRTHWTETGLDRLGVISTARDDRLLKELTKRFRFKARRVNAVRAEIVGPVTEELQADIEAYLENDPDYASFTFLGFYVQTNNSFDRVNFMEGPAQFLPVGNAPEPKLFAFRTGYGDGMYPMFIDRIGDQVAQVSIDFIDPGTREKCHVDAQFDEPSTEPSDFDL